MDEAVGRHGGVAVALEIDGCEQDFPGSQERQVQCEDFCALPITEISDKDYRSFCWPCHEFEEAVDSE